MMGGEAFLRSLRGLGKEMQVKGAGSRGREPWGGASQLT